jgi:hypothetical protein
MIRSILVWCQCCTRKKDCKIDVRRVVGQVQEQSDSLHTAVLLKVASEKSGGFQVDTHGTEDDGEVLLVVIVDTLGRLDQTGLSTNLSGNLVVGQTGGREDGNLLTTSNRVHGVNGRDTGRDHLLGIFLQR